MTRTLRIEKRKWDGSVSAVDVGEALDAGEGVHAWLVRAGSERQRPSKGEVETLDVDELWLAAPGEWWVLCAYGLVSGEIHDYRVHAAAPFEAPDGDSVVWIDLDLDFDVAGDDVSLEDEAEFHAHAKTMAYPDDVVRGAWTGVSVIAARYTNTEWPFDGLVERLFRSL